MPLGLIFVFAAVGREFSGELNWTVQEARGPRHFWQLHHAPPTTSPDAPLVLRVPADAYGLTPTDVVGGEYLVAGASRVERRRGRELLDIYSGLRAWDATGKDLPAWMAVACEPDAPCHVQLTVDERHATYPITVDPLVQAGVVTFPNSGRTPLPWDDERYLARAESTEEVSFFVVERDTYGVYAAQQQFAFVDPASSFIGHTVVGGQYLVSVNLDVGDNLYAYGMVNGTLQLEQSWPVPELEGDVAVLYPDGDDAFVAWANGVVDIAYRFEREADGSWNEVPVAEQDLDGLIFYPDVLPGGLLLDMTPFFVNLLRPGDPALGEDMFVPLDTFRPPCPSGSFPDGDQMYVTSQSERRFLVSYACRLGTETRGAAVDVSLVGTDMVVSPVEGLWEFAGPGAYLPHVDRWVFTSHDVNARGMVEAWQEADGTWSYELVPPVPDLDLDYQSLMAHGPYVVAHESRYFDGDDNNHRFFAFVEAPVLETSELAVDEGASRLLTDVISVVDPDSDPGVHVFRYEYPASYGILVHADGSEVDLGSTFALDGVRYVHDGSETLSDAFDLVVCDEHDLCSPVTQVPVVVTPVNDPPLPLPDAVTVDEGATALVDLLINDSDPDSDLLPENVQVSMPAATGELVVDASGLSFVHDGSEVTDDVFRYLACDPEGACTEAEVTVTVVPVNDPPVAVTDVVSIDEGATVLVDPLANDVDPDSTLSSSQLTLRSLPEGATVAVVPGGLQVTHDGSEPDGSVPSFGYRVCDDQGACGDGVVELEVQPVNDPPVAVDDAIQLEEGGTTSVDVLSNDLDPDDAVLTVELLDVPPALSASVAGGAIELLHDGSEPTGPAPALRYQACDAGGLCAEATLTVSVTPVDDPPVAQDDTATVAEGGSTWVSVLANDLDPDSLLSQVTLTELPENGVATAVAGLIEYVHDGSETSSDSLSYEVCDGSACDTARVELQVLPEDDLPAVTDDRYAGPSPLEVDASDGVLANDSDGDGPLGEAELVEDALHGTVTLQPDGSFVYEAEKRYAGADRFVYSIDGVQGAVWLDIEKGNGCGCASSGPMSLWFVLPLLPGLLRRRGPKHAP